MEIGNNKIETIDGKMLWTPKEPTTATKTVQMTRDFLFEGGYTSLAAEYPYQYTRKCSDGTVRLIFSKHPIGKPPLKYRIPESKSIRDQILEECNLYKHRLDTVNEYIESRKEHMISDHYDDLKYILNECDLESSW